MEFERTHKCQILTNELHQLERQRHDVEHQINIQQIESDYRINSVSYNYGNRGFESQSRYVTNIIKLKEKRDNLDSEIEAVQIQLLQEKSIFEEEQRKEKEEKVRISTEQFINFTNTLSDKEIEEFQTRYEEGKKEQRYKKYMLLRQETEQK
jgi:hypothetical protein